MSSAVIPRGVRIGLVLSISLVLVAATGILALNLGLLAPSKGLPVLAEMPAFHLVDQSGRPVDAPTFGGKLLVVGFIYTSCPDICPVVTAEMATLQAQLDRAGLLGKVELLSISVDPEHDTPERLQDYAQRFGARTDTWRFLTGDPEHLRSVVVDGFMMGMVKYGAPSPGAGSPGAVHQAHGDHAPDYLVEHSGLVALIDQQGRVRAYHDGNGLDHDLVQAQIRQLLRGR